MIGTHVRNLERYPGWVEVSRQGEYVKIVNPEDTCCFNMKRGGTCLLDKGHSGAHSTQVYYCDGCGKARRGRPHLSNEEVAICFLCARADPDYNDYR